MQKYKVISLDMFQTLVDLDTQQEIVMRAVLGENYSPEKGASLWEDANWFVYYYFHRLQNSPENFVPVVRIFEQCYAELFPRYSIKLEPAVGARILAQAHARAWFYPDSLPFLERVQQKYRTCLISDTDLSMIEDLLSRVKFDGVFLSEQYKAYKFDPCGTLFKAACAAFKIEPCEMLHIGDGYSDVAGAKQAGAHAAWINRRGWEWKHELQPDYTITSLLELEEL